MRVFVLTCVAAFVVACSSTTTTPATGLRDASTGEGGAGGTDASTSGDGGGTPRDAGSDGPAAGACASEASRNGCITCCSNFHQDGAAAFLLATIDCLCDASRCKTDCATTLCATDLKDPDARCNQCATDKDAECKGPVAAACAASPECVAFDKCVGDSGCAGKP